MSNAARSAGSDAVRRSVLDAARRFKSTWAELGKLLVQVRDGALWEDWGFPSFDVYCAKEIHIRKATADKLTRSFSFLSKHEPEAANDDAIATRAPPFEVVTVLADAEERGQLSPSEYRSIRDSIWDDQKPAAELKREVFERFPPPAAEPVSSDAMLKRLAATARRMASDARSCRAVPRPLAEQAEALADAFEQLVDVKSE